MLDTLFFLYISYKSSDIYLKYSIRCRYIIKIATVVSQAWNRGLYRLSMNDKMGVSVLDSRRRNATPWDSKIFEAFAGACLWATTIPTDILEQQTK